MNEINSVWDRLHAWFQEHIPEVMDSFHPPVSETKLSHFEEQLGLGLPEGLRESYRIHNGQLGRPGLVYGLRWLSVEESLADWKRSCEAECCNQTEEYGISSYPEFAIQNCLIHSGWIPLTHDSGGNYIGGDFAPDSRGIEGQIIVYGPDDDDHHVLAPDWTSFLQMYVEQLESGNVHIEIIDGDIVFNTKDPNTKHFHNAGKSWSRERFSPTHDFNS